MDIPREAGYGIRDFAEINATMSNVTGVPTTQAAVKTTYDAVFQALPVATGLEGFLSSQQMGITQLAISYCSALVDGNGTIPAGTYFPGFNFGAPVSTAFDTQTEDRSGDRSAARKNGRCERQHTAGGRPDEDRDRRVDLPSRKLQRHQMRGYKRRREGGVRIRAG